MLKTPRILLILVIPIVFVIIFLSTFFSFLYNINYYEKEYKKYNIYERFSAEKARNETLSLFGYFKSRNKLDGSFFNKNEISHLSDVKMLIDKVSRVYYICLFLFWGILVYFYLSKTFISYFGKLLLYSGIFSLSVILLLGFLYLISGFDFLFVRFHEVFFTGNYAFDPDVSNMKALFSDGFFLDICLAVIFQTLLKAILLIVTGRFIIKRSVV